MRQVKKYVTCRIYRNTIEIFDINDSKEKAERYLMGFLKDTKDIKWGSKQYYIQEIDEYIDDDLTNG